MVSGFRARRIRALGLRVWGFRCVRFKGLGGRALVRVKGTYTGHEDYS